jgi:FtsP/CotA-like multicopper oxidase with cupredoxin domain
MNDPSSPHDPPVPPADARDQGATRRELLVGGAAAAGTVALGGLLSACGGSSSTAAGGKADYTIRAKAAEVDLGGRKVTTWTYDGVLPGPELRLKQGRAVRIRLINELDAPTSIHWHGLRIANAADGVPGMTQKAVAPGSEYVYTFTPPDAGTFMFHSHVGMQLDRGLYGPLIVEPASEPGAYDQDVVLLIDDWLDGLAGTPDARLAKLRASGMQMGGMHMGSTGTNGARGKDGRHTALSGSAPRDASLARMANLLEGGKLDPGDVPDYPLYLINGQPPSAPTTVSVRRGDRVRLRLINPSADTIYCVFVEGHELQVIAADGMPVKPVTTDALVLGMGERYDVLVDAKGSGIARIAALPLGKRGRAISLLRYRGATGNAPAENAPLPAPRRVLSYSDLQPISSAVAPTPGSSPRVIRLDLAMGKGRYVWTIGGQAFPKADPIKVSRGEHIQFVMRNTTMMPHPMHLHGHSFRVGSEGPLKDTALAIPKQELTLDWVADNHGTWAYHCHNAYHQEAGMMRRVVVS